MDPSLSILRKYAAKVADGQDVYCLCHSYAEQLVETCRVDVGVSARIVETEHSIIVRKD